MKPLRLIVVRSSSSSIDDNEQQQPRLSEIDLVLQFLRPPCVEKGNATAETYRHEQFQTSMPIFYLGPDWCSASGALDLIQMIVDIFEINALAAQGTELAA